MTRLSLFPLSGIVLPGGQLPLRIFEPRYLSMVSACFKRGEGFGVLLISKGSEVGAAAETFEYGTLVEIIDWDQEDSGLLVIATRGVQKFRVLSCEANEQGLLMGDVELLALEQKTTIPEIYQPLADLLHRALEQVQPLLVYEDTDFDDATWVSSRLVELLPMAVSERHDLLAMDDAIERMRVLSEIVGRHS